MIANIETFNQIAAGRNVRFDRHMIVDFVDERFGEAFVSTPRGWAFIDYRGIKLVSIEMIAGEVDAVFH